MHMRFLWRHSFSGRYSAQSSSWIVIPHPPWTACKIFPVTNHMHGIPGRRFFKIQIAVVSGLTIVIEVFGIGVVLSSIRSENALAGARGHVPDTIIHERVAGIRELG